MGNNQVKTTTSPMLPAESCALSCQDYQEKQIRKGIPRRVGSMILSHWILMKRREQAILEKARRAVSEGRAPAEILEKIEKHVAKETKKYHIKYHPRVLARKSKPVRIRLKAPKLTNTAARRIQASFQRREKEQEEATKEAKRHTRSRISVKSHGWTDSGIPNDQRATQMNHLDRKRSLSVPPTSTLSLQSITTAESSSGIGMSRASSMTSVASSRSKSYYTRQRGRSLEEDDKLLEALRELQERHKMQKPVRGGSCNSVRRYLGEASGRHRCTTAQRYAQQQLELEQHSQQQRKKGKSRRNKVDDQLQDPQQKNKQDSSEHKVRDERHKDKQTPQRQDSHPQVRKNKEQPSHRSDNNKATSTREDGRQQQSSHERDGNQDARKRRQNKNEKKDQASQTRMSGPPRPRRLLLARQLKKQPRTSQERHREQEQLRVRFKHSEGANPVDNSNSETRKILTYSREKSASGIVQSEKKQDLRSKPIKSREDQHLKLPKGNSGQVSADKRKKSYIDIDDLNVEGKQHERLQKQEPEGPRESHHQGTGRETNIQVSRHEVQLHRSIHGDEAQSRQHDTKQEHSDKHIYQQEQPSLNHSQLRRQSRSQQTDECGDMLEELSVNSQEQEQLNHKTKLAKQNLEIMQPQLSEFFLQAPVELTQGSGVVKKLPDTECTVEARGGGRVGTLSKNDHPGGSLEHIHTVEAQSEGHLGRSQERGIAVESEGGGRRRRLSEREYNTESHAERRSRKSLDRRRLSASIEHLQTPATERTLPETSLERGRRHQHTELDSFERGHRQQLTDHVLNDHTIETVRREPLLESTHGGHFVERIRHDPLLERFRSEPSLHNIHHEPPTRYVHRARVVEYTRHEPVEHLRQDIRVSHEPFITAGRSASPVHHRRTIYTHEGLRVSPESGRNTVRQRDHGYSSDTSELGYIRSYREHRYNGGFLDPIHAGAYSERTYTARSLEPNYRRLSLDNQSRSVEPDYSRSFSERSFVRNSIDKYPERVLGESRWRSTDDWEDGERKRYREMITPINTLSPSLDHRAL